MEAKFIFVLIPVLVLPWVVLFFIMMASNKKVVSNFNKLKEKYELHADFSKKVGMKNHPNAEGIYRNRSIKVESVIKDSVDGKKITPHTVLSVDCANSEGFTFFAVRRNRKNAAEFLHGSVLVEDNEFDNKFILHSNNPEKLKRIFDLNTRFKLDQVHKLGFEGKITLNGNVLQYSEAGLLSTDEALMRTELVMHEFCDIAEVMRYN